MQILIFGATGMVGQGTLLECLDDPRVTSVIAIVRRATGRSHPKLREIVHRDFFDFTALRDTMTGIDACFFCLGMTSAGLQEAEYTHLTHDLTLAAARAQLAANPRATFCYISGLGADSTEKGRVMWARVRGRTENDLFALPFRAVHVFRPGIILPVRGVRSATVWYNRFYAVARPLWPLIRRLAPSSTTTTATIGKALIEIAVNGTPQQILYSKDFARLAGTLD